MAHSRDAQVRHLVCLQAKKCLQKTLPHLWYTIFIFYHYIFCPDTTVLSDSYNTLQGT